MVIQEVLCKVLILLSNSLLSLNNKVKTGNYIIITFSNNDSIRFYVVLSTKCLQFRKSTKKNNVADCFFWLI